MFDCSIGRPKNRGLTGGLAGQRDQPFQIASSIKETVQERPALQSVD